MAKRRPVPAKSHQYVKRQKKFIEMPMDKFWKIVASVAAVIVAIVLFFVLQKYLVEGVKMSGLKS